MGRTHSLVLLRGAPLLVLHLDIEYWGRCNHGIGHECIDTIYATETPEEEPDHRSRECTSTARGECVRVGDSGPPGASEG